MGPELDGMDIGVKVRSTRPPEPAKIVWSDGQISVRLENPDEGISPGQACVFYAADAAQARVLGGGWITRTA